MQWVTTIGLILNVLGSVIFIVDSNRLSGILSSLFNHVVAGFGLWDQEPFTEEQRTELENSITRSKNWSIWGYILFVSGFVLQLIAVWM